MSIWTLRPVLTIIVDYFSSEGEINEFEHTRTKITDLVSNDKFNIFFNELLISHDFILVKKNLAKLIKNFALYKDNINDLTLSRAPLREEFEVLGIKAFELTIRTSSVFLNKLVSINNFELAGIESLREDLRAVQLKKFQDDINSAIKVIDDAIVKLKKIHRLFSLLDASSNEADTKTEDDKMRLAYHDNKVTLLSHLATLDLPISEKVNFPILSSFGYTAPSLLPYSDVAHLTETIALWKAMGIRHPEVQWASYVTPGLSYEVLIAQATARIKIFNLPAEPSCWETLCMVTSSIFKAICCCPGCCCPCCQAARVSPTIL